MSDHVLQAVEVGLSEEGRPADARGDLQDPAAEVVQQRLKVLGGAWSEGGGVMRSVTRS